MDVKIITKWNTMWNAMWKPNWMCERSRETQMKYHVKYDVKFTISCEKIIIYRYTYNETRLHIKAYHFETQF